MTHSDEYATLFEVVGFSSSFLLLETFCELGEKFAEKGGCPFSGI
jgi:hypothetical protein